MPLNRAGDVMIGAELQAVLLPSTAVATGTYHFAAQPAGSVVLGSAVSGYTLKTGAPTGSQDVLYSSGKYLTLVIAITNVNGGTLTVTIVGQDAASNTAYTILASAGLVANATTILRVGPTYTAAANTIANDIIPLTWNVQVVVATATMTFSLGALQGS